MSDTLHGATVVGQQSLAASEAIVRVTGTRTVTGSWSLLAHEHYEAAVLPPPTHNKERGTGGEAVASCSFRFASSTYCIAGPRPGVHETARASAGNGTPVN